MADSDSPAPDQFAEEKRKRTIGLIILVILLILILLLLFFGCFRGNKLVFEPFDDGPAGWKVIGDADETAGAEFLPEGGNPGGHVEANDQALGGVWFWSAPEDFRAEFAEDVLANSDEPGLRFVFDLKQSNTADPFDYHDVVLASADLRLTHSHGEHPKLEWTSYEISLNPEDWRVGSSDEAPTPELWLDVLRNLEKIEVRGEFRTGDDVGHLDNIGLKIVD